MLPTKFEQRQLLRFCPELGHVLNCLLNKAYEWTYSMRLFLFVFIDRYSSEQEPRERWWRIAYSKTRLGWYFRCTH